ncbi:SIMPL domain-containing protein [Oceanobacillus kimchii]|uniref:SIMPL domain-containing protein n=1 Tax=Oceanobacillus kimchii TaxID=746691 RepID=UPI00232F3468|nr:SIMPL domain-containing protein [Oceanobacillus kimchii]
MYYHYVPSQMRQSLPMRQTNSTITITGTGSVLVVPSIAHVRLAVVTRNASLEEAQQQNNESMTNVIRVIVNEGIPRESIQTTSFSARPIYDYVDGKQIFETFEVRNEITITLEDLDRLGEIIDLAINQGANEVVSVTFSVDDPENFYEEALTLALRNAESKAEVMAQELGVSLNPIPTKITEVDSDGNGVKLFAASTPVEPGTQRIEASVKVDYQLQG